MRRAIQRRDAGYDGAFYFAVRTTGVFCNPSCSARKPHARHCVYFRTPSEAIRAGYRPCKRCRPEQADTLAPDWIRPLLARVDSGDGERLTDRDLRAMGLSPFRVRRFFRSKFGMTFQRFARQRRLASAVTHIRKGLDVTTTALRSGYESISGFESAARRAFGTSARRVTAVQPVFSKTINSPIGPLLLGANDEGLCVLSFSEGRSVAANLARLSRQLKCPVLAGPHELLDAAADQLTEYFAGKRREFDLPLHYPGTPFQRAVWSALRRIPYGRTTSYEQLARAVGRPGAQRAVGTANGSNRIAIIIPCHRVVNKSGKIGGYGGGVWRKEFLLELERSAASR
ncbi:MAG: methylated-DNA--[protein]-cysteine S-methyltransferase [Planctomycetia bacterium]|nr:MAG: methylated-DNA--[protein]-cysteine S-methyltransferase [Planctomycetia bacterium]